MNPPEPPLCTGLVCIRLCIDYVCAVKSLNKGHLGDVLIIQIFCSLWRGCPLSEATIFEDSIISRDQSLVFIRGFMVLPYLTLLSFYFM